LCIEKLAGAQSSAPAADYPGSLNIRKDWPGVMARACRGSLGLASVRHMPDSAHVVAVHVAGLLIRGVEIERLAFERPLHASVIAARQGKIARAR
jgi:hypothetical protein